MPPPVPAPPVVIGGRPVGAGSPVWIIAEVSANHAGSLERTIDIVRAAAAAGVDAVKLQTYTADTMTLDAPGPRFEVEEGMLWAGRRLHELYAEAAMPWEWYGELAQVAADLGLQLFSTPFDRTAVDFLEQFDPPVYKIASFELIDIPLIRYTASTGRPLLMSTGMATEDEIDAAVFAARDAGAKGIVLLRCNSAYPADPREMDLRSIPAMVERWGVPVGLSDHTLTDTAAIAAVALGAVALEKHVTLDRAEPGPDSAFSLEPAELGRLVNVVREASAALGEGPRFGPSPSERKSLAFRRSVMAVADIAPGEPFTDANIAVLRPAGGLPPVHFDELLGRRAATTVRRGDPVGWDAVEGGAAQPTG